MRHISCKTPRSTRKMCMLFCWSYSGRQPACTEQAADPQISQSVIELPELQSRLFLRVYEAIRNLRPSWLPGTLWWCVC